jgi:hypothetical protein
MCAPSAAPCPEGPQRAHQVGGGPAADGRESRDIYAFERVMGSRRVWRRLAKRATAAYERDLAKLARSVAATAPLVRFATSRPLRGSGEAAVAVLTLSLPGWELELSGVAAAAGMTAELAAGTAGSPRLTRTGRYGAFWWIELSADGDQLVLLGSQLRLWATGEGDGPAGAHTPPLAVVGSRG